MTENNKTSYNSLRLLGDIRVVAPFKRDAQSMCLLYVLGLRANISKQYSEFVSQDVLAVETGMCARTVRDRLNRLEKAGWIQRQARFNKSDLIWVNAVRIQQEAATIRAAREAKRNEKDNCPFEQPEAVPASVSSHEAPAPDAQPLPQNQGAGHNNAVVSPSNKPNKGQVESLFYSLSVMPHVPIALTEKDRRWLAEDAAKNFTEAECVLALFCLSDGALARLRTKDVRNPAGYLRTMIREKVEELQQADKKRAPLSSFEIDSIKKYVDSLVGQPSVGLAHINLTESIRYVEVYLSVFREHERAGKFPISILRIEERNGAPSLVIRFRPMPGNSSAVGRTASKSHRFDEPSDEPEPDDEEERHDEEDGEGGDEWEMLRRNYCDEPEEFEPDPNAELEEYFDPNAEPEEYAIDPNAERYSY